MQSLRRRAFVSAVLASLAFAPTSLRARTEPTAEPTKIQFVVTYPASVLDAPTKSIRGRVVVFLAKAGSRQRRGEPRFGPNWFAPQPTFAVDVADAKPGEKLTLSSDRWIAFPPPPERMKKGEYEVQAVIDRDLGGRTIGASPGNLYSTPLKIALDPDVASTVELVCDHLVVEPKFVESAHVKECRVESKLLSEFYGRPTEIRAAVALPDEWSDEPERHFPVYYSVPGFGGTHMGQSGREAERGNSRGGESFLVVTLDPDCPGGHSAFADSANNGPWGKALVTEFIPECEKRFRGIGTPEARFVGGHSSGGWSSLWLQVTYPDVFGGCWSTSPDPVDFRDFQQIDLYADGENMFVDHDGRPRGIARRDGAIMIFYRQFSDMERPLRGEQLGSFEAAFSPRGADGKPKLLWDRDTGAIDHAVAEAWKPYDIALTLRTHWKELAPRLAGKIHVYMGTEDTFFLDGAVRLMKKDLAAIGADVVIEMFPGDHGTVMTPELLARIDAEMAAQYKKGRKQRQRARRPRVPRPAAPLVARA